jgi:hypothetical protein
LMLLLELLLRRHPLKLDLPPAVIHDHPSAWGTSMSTLLVVSGANLNPPVLVMGIGVGCPVPSGIAPLAAAPPLTTGHRTEERVGLLFQRAAVLSPSRGRT